MATINICALGQVGGTPKWVDLIRLHDIEQIKLLLTNQLAANAAPGPQWEAPIIEAVRCQHLETVALLIKLGADLEAPSTNLKKVFGNPLSLAVQQHDWAMARMLIDGGAARQGLTDLDFAVVERDYQKVLDLAGKASALEIESYHGLGGSLFDLAAPDRRIISILTSGKHFKYTFDLELAAMLNDTNAALRSLSGKPPEQVSHEFYRSLPVAIQWDSLEVLKIIINAGWDVNNYLEHDMTALCLAAKYGNKRIVRWLLENGAKTNLVCNGVFLAQEIAKSLKHPDCEDIIKAANR